MYNLRHNGDLELFGKVIYFITCFLNTCSIFLSYAMYYTGAFATFLLTLVIVIRKMSGLGDYDLFPKSNEIIMGFLIVCFCIIPTTLLPKIMARFVDRLTKYFILQEEMHQLLGYRSGYKIPGLHHASYMFLPQSYANYRNPKSSLAIMLTDAFTNQDFSRRFYRLKYQLQIWNKIFMHLFYFVSSATFLHLWGYLLEEGGVTKSVFHLRVMQVPLLRSLG